MIEIRYAKPARKALDKAPQHIRKKLNSWAKAVILFGLAEVKKQPGYHDEPLQGKWFGCRSIRLTSLWRAIYSETGEAGIQLILIERVVPHDYENG